MKFYSALLSTATLLAAMPFAAEAQEAPAVAEDPQAGLDVVTVTAQRRAQNAQDVPIAVSTFTADDLEGLPSPNVEMLASFAPNVQLTSSSTFAGSPSVLSAFIRGIGQNDIAGNFEPGVGVYVDGVYLARMVGANVNLMDIERIEILKGPQGTLFGRNTIGGAISIVTERPSDEFAITGELTVGAFDRTDFRGRVDIPLIQDRLLTSVAFSLQDRTGWQERIPYPGADGFVADPSSAFDGHPSTAIYDDTHGGVNEDAIRARALWLISPTMELNVSADYLHGYQSGFPTSLLATGETNLSTLAALYNGCLVDAFNPISAAVCGRIAGPNLAGVNVDADPDNDRLFFGPQFITNDPDTTYATNLNYSETTNWGVAATFEWELPFAEFKSITAYRDLEWISGQDLDGSPIAMLELSAPITSVQLSQEFQLTGESFGDRLDWLVGAYYFNEEVTDNSAPPVAAGLFQIEQTVASETDAYAAFAHLNFDITDRLSLTLGGRYTEETKTLTAMQVDRNALYQIPIFAFPPFIYPDPTDLTILGIANGEEQEFSNTSLRVGLEYELTDDMMIYGSFSQGFKSGGWTTRLALPALQYPRFTEETADTYELGFKSEFFDRRFRFNAAAFSTEYSDIQVDVITGLSPAVLNAGDAEIQGFEIETLALISDNLQLRANVGYLHGEYTEISPAAAAFVGIDNNLVRLPEWTIQIGPRYEHNLSGGGAFAAWADYNYTTEMNLDVQNSATLVRLDVGVLNVGLSYTSADEHWGVTLGGQNVTDERYLVNGFAFSAVGVEFGTFNPPPQWYVSLSFRN